MGAFQVLRMYLPRLSFLFDVALAHLDALEASDTLRYGHQ